MTRDHELQIIGMATLASLCGPDWDRRSAGIPTRYLEAPEPASLRAPRPSYSALWNARLQQRRNGEHPDRPGTWVLDGLWRAAALERNAKESVALLTAMTKLDNVSDELLERLTRDAETTWSKADVAYQRYFDGVRRAA